MSRGGGPALLALGLGLALAAWIPGCQGKPTPPSPEAGEPRFDGPFWDRWGDGRAEVSAYDLVFPRYGHLRTGEAITVFVTETFSHEARVKADPGVHPKSDEYPVMKLNLMQDFSTGIYDYHLMTSAFYGITPRDSRPAGSPAKVSFSSHEWCGIVFHELLPDAQRIRSISHSYFDGEGDRTETLKYPRDAVFEDGLFHWARGLAFPVLKPGESRTVPILRSTELVRLLHVPLVWETADLHRSGERQKIEVPAGKFTVETFTAEIHGDPDHERTWTFLVEVAPPHRIIRWEASDGRRADLLGSDRLAYWKMHDPGFEKQLSRIGLSARPPRTP